jgi:Domain of unknown function (DUF4105)
MIKRLLLICFCALPFLCFSQQINITESTRISILTVDVADESHSLYGHTALRIKDSNFDYVYNYGMFDFDTKNFMLKFVKGDLQYFAVAYPYQDFEYSYRIENRSIYEQVLDISVQEKQLLFNKLITSLSSDEKYYTYKFIDKNCTTKVIDIVNQALDNSPITKKNIAKKTYRDVLFPYVKDHFYEKLGINIIFGKKVDTKATKLFLPLDLYDNLKVTTYKNKPLITETTTLFQANRAKPAFSFLDSVFSLLAILLLFIVFSDRKISQVIYFLFLGLLGLFFSLVGLYSFHQEVLWNYNVFLFNPLFLVLVYFIIKNNAKWIKKISISCIAIISVYTFYMFTIIHFIVVLPIIITTTIMLLRVFFKKTS